MTSPERSFQDTNENKIDAAAAAGKTVYMPAGKYNLHAQLRLPSNAQILGAGMWHTELIFSQIGGQSFGGVRGEGTNLALKNVYIKGAQTIRSDQGYHGIKGLWDDGSVIESVWVENTGTGVWLANFQSPFQQSDNLTIRNSRFRNTFADGINLSSGTSCSVVENCHIRGTGDDGLATWAAGVPFSTGPTEENVFRYNTIECGYRAAGIGIFGGKGHRVHHNRVSDTIGGAGLRLNTTFIFTDGQTLGYPFSNTGELMYLYDNTLTRTGAKSLFNNEIGAIELNVEDGDVTDLLLDRITIEGSIYNGIGIQKSLDKNFEFNNVIFRNIDISGTPIGTVVDGDAEGNVRYDNVSLAAGIQAFDLNGSALNIEESYAGV